MSKLVREFIQTQIEVVKRKIDKINLDIDDLQAELAKKRLLLDEEKQELDDIRAEKQALGY